MSSDKPRKRSPKPTVAPAAQVDATTTTPTPAVPAPAKPRPSRARAAVTAATAAPTTAADAAVLTFAAGWQELQQGTILAGGSLVLEYEPARLLESLAAEAAGGDIVGYARFSPGGPVQSAPLLGGTAARATRRAAASTPVAAEIPVPAEAEEVELWFERRGAEGSTSWDSRFGANYRFDVVRRTQQSA
jgi:hypothetical protein